MAHHTVRSGYRDLTDEVRRWSLFQDLWQDIRFTFRSLRRIPGFTTVSVLSLALGIGINLSIASYINALFFRPIAGVPDSEQLVSIYRRTAAERFSSSSYPEYEYCRDHNRAFTGMLAYLRVPMILRSSDQAEQVFGELTSGNYFSVLDLRPTLGRFYAADESSPFAVLNHAFWLRRFGGDQEIIGRSLRIGNGIFTVIGVAPPGFRGVVVDWAEQPSLWIPLGHNRDAVPAFRGFDILRTWTMESYQVVARMRRDAAMREAEEEVAGFVARMRVDRPERFLAYSKDKAESHDAPLVAFRTIQTRFWPGHRSSLFSFLGLLGGVAILILLISCFNVANLVLARATNRRAEFAIRLSLGAGRGRLMRQLLTENLILAGLGSVAGLAVADWTSTFLAGYGRISNVPLAVDSRVDIRVLAIAAILSMIVGVLLALFTARFASGGDLNTALKTGTGTAGSSRLRAGRTLVFAQVSVSMVLLVGAGLFARTLRNAQVEDVTLRSAQVLVASVDLGSAGYEENRGGIFYTQLLERVRAVPGVLDAAFVFVVPLGGRRGGTNIVLDGQSQPIQIGFNIITPGYFRTIGIPFVRGRDLADTDRAGGTAVAVINEEMARRLFPERDPLGSRFLLQWKPAAIVEIVGIVKDGKFRDYRSSPEPTVYVPLAQRYVMQMNIEVRTAGNPAKIAPFIQREAAILDKNMPLLGMTTLKAHFDNGLSQERLSASLLTGLGILALILVAIGVHGVLAYAVARRTREIGIRMALGAQPRSILWVVLGGMLLLVGTGLAAGILASLWLARFVEKLLYGISPLDPLVFCGMILVMFLVALLAALVPAMRASRVSPAFALRCE
jgi:predicted permease